MNPLVSIIIPTYNRESLILKALDSAVKQTYSNKEIIIIDDGSTDKTEKVVRNYINTHNLNYIKYHKYTNSGVSSARNKGIKLAAGQYIAFLDSDDLWVESKLEKQINRLNKTKYEICYCGTKVMSKKTYNIPNTFKEGYILKDLIRAKTDAQTITWVISKPFLLKNNIMFDETCNYSEDLEFFLKCATLGKCCTIKEFLAFYYIHKGSRLSDNTQKKNQELAMWERYKNWLHTHKQYVQLYDITYYIDKYRLPATIISSLYRTIADKNYENGVLFYDANIKNIKNFNPLLGRYTIRFIYYLFYIKFVLNTKR